MFAAGFEVRCLRCSNSSMRSTLQQTGPSASMSLTRLRTAARRGAAARRRQMERARQTPFRRRRRRPRSVPRSTISSLRSTPCSRAKALRSPRIVWKAVRRAIGRCANSWRESWSAPRHRVQRRRSSSPPARCRGSISSTAFCSIAATRSSPRPDLSGSLNRWTRLGVNAVGIPARRRRHAHRCTRGRARRSEKAWRARQVHLHHPDRAESDRHDLAEVARRLEMLRLVEQHGVPIFEDDCYADLIWDGRRRRRCTP